MHQLFLSSLYQIFIVISANLGFYLGYRIKNGKIANFKIEHALIEH